MKYVILFMCLIVFTNTKANTDSAIVYTGVVQVENISSDELYIRARAWFNTTFKNSREVLQISDKETGELAGKGNFDITVPFQGAGKKVYQNRINIKFFVNVWVKDGRFKYEISQLEAISKEVGEYSFGALTSSNEMPVKFPMVKKTKADRYWLDIKSETEKEVKIMINSLKSAMSESTSGENW